MITVKNAQTSATLFQQRASAAGPQYLAGVQAAGPKWSANTGASAANWVAGVQLAIQDNRFVNGVNGAQGKYVNNASGKGARNYPTAVGVAGPAWLAATQPFLTVISNINLPPRGPVGSPTNIARVSAVTDALRQAKMSGV